MGQIPKIVILLETRRDFDRQLLTGIGQYARLHGPWALHVVSDDLEHFKPTANWRETAGVITRLGTSQLVKAVNSANVPVVLVDAVGSPSTGRFRHRIADVFADSEGIARLAAEYLVSRRFERFAFVGLPNQNTFELRCNSFGDVVRRLGHPLYAYPTLDTSEVTWIEERAALANWLDKLPKPIGLMACDDERAFQVLEACRIARIPVPDHLAVIGVGNDELICEMANPALSSIAVNAVHGGYQAARVLDQYLRQELQTHQQLVVEPNHVIVRASTDIDASGDPLVNAARSMIRRDFGRGFSITALAKAVGASRRVLEVKFRKQTGRSIWEEVRELRIARAKMILKATKLPITEVATLSGYQSASHLVQLFARRTGLTPSKYRIAARVSPMHEKSLWHLANLGRDTA